MGFHKDAQPCLPTHFCSTTVWMSVKSWVIAITTRCHWMLPTVLCDFMETCGPLKFAAGVVKFLRLLGFAKSWLCLAFCETKLSKAISLRLLEFLVERSSCPLRDASSSVTRMPFLHSRLSETVMKQGIWAFHIFNWSWR